MNREKLLICRGLPGSSSGDVCMYTQPFLLLQPCCSLSVRKGSNHGKNRANGCRKQRAQFQSQPRPTQKHTTRQVPSCAAEGNYNLKETNT